MLAKLYAYLNYLIICVSNNFLRNIKFVCIDKTNILSIVRRPYDLLLKSQHFLPIIIQLINYLNICWFRNFLPNIKSCSARQAGHFKRCFEYLAHTVQKLKIWLNQGMGVAIWANQVAKKNASLTFFKTTNHTQPIITKCTMDPFFTQTTPTNTNV